ncbi:MAG: hypothetical protein HY046_01915 [Acidobacteria bacterium]|nr:hypothetical protein [Acidobacteriota bacterium]
MRVHFGNVIRIGDVVYGSSGDHGPAPFTAVDIKTGETLWRYRDMGRSTLLLADGKLIALEEDGDLALLSVTPQGVTVLSKAKVLESLAWTVPTLAGTTLYLRDRKQVMALDLRQ